MFIKKSKGINFNFFNFLGLNLYIVLHGDYLMSLGKKIYILINDESIFILNFIISLNASYSEV